MEVSGSSAMTLHYFAEKIRWNSRKPRFIRPNDYVRLITSRHPHPPRRRPHRRPPTQLGGQQMAPAERVERQVAVPIVLAGGRTVLPARRASDRGSHRAQRRSSQATSGTAGPVKASFKPAEAATVPKDLTRAGISTLNCTTGHMLFASNQARAHLLAPSSVPCFPSVPILDRG